MTEYEEADEYCPNCDNQYVRFIDPLNPGLQRWQHRSQPALLAGDPGFVYNRSSELDIRAGHSGARGLRVTGHRGKDTTGCSRRRGRGCTKRL